MSRLRKRLGIKMGARARIEILMALLVILLLSVGCNTSDTDLPEKDPEISEEVSVDETEDPIEEVVEVTPVERKTTQTGGMQVVSPEGTTVNEFEFVTIENERVGFVELGGVELKKTYNLDISGTTSKDSKIIFNIIDGSDIKSLEEIDMESVRIIDSREIQVLGDFDESIKFTNSLYTTRNAFLYVLLEDDEAYLKEVSINRHIGELKFSDEFDYDGLPSEDWTYELGGNGWGNGELQYYNGDDLDNASVGQGELTITAMEEKKDKNDYTSARMRTKDSFKYGRYEIRAKLPYGRGTWPAIWMLPAGNNYGNWPNSGEIDIMEHVGHDMDVVHGSLHMSAFNFRKNNHPTAIMNIPEVDTEYHTYTLEWTTYQIDMYIDDYHYMSFKNDGQGPKHWPFDEKFYLLLNIAVGGAWGGQEGIDPIFPQEMIIDYVRIYDIEDDIVDTKAPEKIEEVTYGAQGTTVFFDFEPVEDNYKVDYYEVNVMNKLDSKSIETRETNGFVYGLNENSNYNIEFIAVDEMGNKSETYLGTFATKTTSVNLVNEWVTPENSYFVSGAKISELESNNYITGFEAEDLMAYRFDVKDAGEYKLELEISGKLFDGEVALLNSELEELVSFIATKTGDKEVYEVVMTEGFTLEKGEQVLFLKTIINGYQLKNVRLINGE